MPANSSNSRGRGIQSRSLADVLDEALAKSRKRAMPPESFEATSTEEAWRELNALRSLGTPPTIH